MIATSTIVRKHPRKPIKSSPAINEAGLIKKKKTHYHNIGVAGMRVTRSSHKSAVVGDGSGAFDALVHVAKLCEAIYAIEEEDAVTAPATVAPPSSAITITSDDITERNGGGGGGGGGGDVSAYGASFAPVRRAKGTILRVGNLFDNNDNGAAAVAAAAVCFDNVTAPAITAAAAFAAFDDADGGLARVRERFMAAFNRAARDAWAELGSVNKQALALA